MGKLTFPIDTMEPGEIPAFRHIFEQYPSQEEVLSKVLRYLCYRFDPNHESRETTPAGRKSEALVLSGYVEPGQPIFVDENGSLVIPPEQQMVMDATTFFFSVLNNNDWEEICSLEFMIAEAHEIMRTPIPKDASPDSKLKLSELKIKLSSGVASMSARYKLLITGATDSDPVARLSLEQSAPARKRRDMTGRKVE